MSQSLVTQGKDFLISFLHNLNEKYGTTLSLPDICQLVKNNSVLHSTRLEYLESLFIIVDSLEKEFLQNPNISMPLRTEHRRWYWPFAETSENDNSYACKSEGLPGQLQPGTLIGTLEVIAGTAIIFCFGSTAVGGIIGGGLVTDGLTRIANDGQFDLEQAFRERQTYLLPPE